jgi:hypothetical protein
VLALHSRFDKQLACNRTPGSVDGRRKLASRGGLSLAGGRLQTTTGGPRLVPTSTKSGAVGGGGTAAHGREGPTLAVKLRTRAGSPFLLSITSSGSRSALSAPTLLRERCLHKPCLHAPRPDRHHLACISLCGTARAAWPSPAHANQHSTAQPSDSRSPPARCLPTMPRPSASLLATSML